MPDQSLPFAVILLTAAIAFGSPAGAQDASQTPQAEAVLDMEAIEKAFVARDFVTVRKGLEALAAQSDDPLVQYRLGRALVQGLGGPADRVGAIAALEKAVAQNHAPASVLLARIFLAEGEFYRPERAASLLAAAAPGECGSAISFGCSAEHRGGGAAGCHCGLQLVSGGQRSGKQGSAV
ncbi:hypothetical protein [Sulfitobacter aestuariivivens]|uniref:hypothetical protein n=1 Tax=Sulfitobacter aestuariivivens TaxID=2766981 RepID=UPI0036064123